MMGGDNIIYMKYNYSKFQVSSFKFHDKGGFTLVEILVALGIFSLVVSAAVGAFVGSSSSQKKTIELYDTQREASYLMETVSRELRMTTKLCNDTSVDCAAKENQENNEDSDIEFKNYDGEWIIYCKADSFGGCDDVDGNYFARDGEIINSSDVIIEDLTFYTSEDFGSTQPIVTIVMKVKSTGKYGTSITLQNSIAMRIYK